MSQKNALLLRNLYGVAFIIFLFYVRWLDDSASQFHYGLLLVLSIPVLMMAFLRAKRDEPLINEQLNELVEPIFSADGAVEGRLEAFPPLVVPQRYVMPERVVKGKHYVVTIIRAYQDGVFKIEEEFDSLTEAKDWLNVNFQSEVEKHNVRLNTKSKTESRY